MRAFLHSIRPFTMFNGLLLLILGTVTVIAQTATNEVTREWGKVVESYSLSIMTTKTNYAPGEPVILSIAQKNVGKQDATLIVAAPLAFSEVKLRLPDKQRGFPTRDGGRRIEDARNEVSLGQIVLKPGETTSSDITLNELYDLTQNGKYLISVTRRFKTGGKHSPNKSEWAELVSNEIAITIFKPKVPFTNQPPTR